MDLGGQYRQTEENAVMSQVQDWKACAQVVGDGRKASRGGITARALQKEDQQPWMIDQTEKDKKSSEASSAGQLALI